MIDGAADIAVVLPQGERFSPSSAGAISLLAHRLGHAPSPFTRIVVGSACPGPFADIPFLPVSPAGLSWHKATRYAAGIARRLIPPRLIEVHNRADLALALKQRFPRSKVALFLHNDPLAMRAIDSSIGARLDGFVAVSAYLADRLRQVVPQTPITIIPNAIGTDTAPTAAFARAPRILFVGRVVADKGADGFVAACQAVLPRLPGWQAEMIGADRFGPASPETPFLRALRPKADAAGVRMTGYRPHPAVLVAMSQAAIVVVPSRWAEPFGLTALEAMACGAALVCTRRAGLAEVAGDAALDCDPDDPGALAETLYALASDPDKRAALATKGLARARLFDTRRVAEALDGWRASLLGETMKEK